MWACSADPPTARSVTGIGITTDQMPKTLKITANVPHAITTITIEVTTACVAASPTADELLPH